MLKEDTYVRTCVHMHTVESQVKGTFRQYLLSFVRRLSSLGGPKCIGTNYREKLRTYILRPQVVSFVERVSLLWHFHYWRFQYRWTNVTHYIYCAIYHHGNTLLSILVPLNSLCTPSQPIVVCGTRDSRW